MTIQVSIKNEDQARSVLVTTQDVKDGGALEDADKIVVPPGGVRTLWVHRGREVHIEEIRTPEEEKTDQEKVAEEEKRAVETKSDKPQTKYDKPEKGGY